MANIEHQSFVQEGCSKTDNDNNSSTNDMNNLDNNNDTNNNRRCAPRSTRTGPARARPSAGAPGWRAAGRTAPRGSRASWPGGGHGSRACPVSLRCWFGRRTTSLRPGDGLRVGCGGRFFYLRPPSPGSRAPPCTEASRRCPRRSSCGSRHSRRRSAGRPPPAARGDQGEPLA